MNAKHEAELKLSEAIAKQAENDNASPQDVTFRVVIETEHDGQEHRGWRGVPRERAEKIAALIDRNAFALESAGRLPRRPVTLFGARARGRK